MIKQLFAGTFKLYVWPVSILVAVFIVSMVLGAVLPYDAKIIVLDAIGQKFEGIINGADTQFELTTRIFGNNLLVAIIAYALGFTIVLPLFIMVSNGIIMGLFLSLLFRADAITPGLFLESFISLIPHGIFELTAFFLAAALSIMVVVKSIFHKAIESHKTRLRFLYESLLRFVVVIVPMLIVAGFIEVYVSNTVGNSVAGWISTPTYSEDQKIPLNNSFLAEHGCLLQQDKLEPFDTRPLSESLTATAKVVYNDSIYTLLKNRKAIPYWEEDYYCDDDKVISVQAWPADIWSVTQAQQLQSAIFVEAQLPIEAIQETPYVIATEVAEETYYLGVFDYGTSTVMLTWNEDYQTLYEDLLVQ